MKNEKRGGSTDRPTERERERERDMEREERGERKRKKKGLGSALFFKDLKELEFRTFSIQHTAHRTWRSLLSRLEGALGVRSSEFIFH